MKFKSETKKTDNYIPKYSYESLKRILKNATEKIEAGNKDAEVVIAGMSAGYAIDMVDISRDIKKPLDLTARTDDNLFPCLVAACAENQRRGMSEEENRANLTKKLGYYQLYSIVNSMNCERKTTEIIIEGNVMTREIKPVISTLPDKDGKTHSFDVMAAAKETINQMQILDPKQSGGAILFGELAPFYQRLEKELIDYLK